MVCTLVFLRTSERDPPCGQGPRLGDDRAAEIVTCDWLLLTRNGLLLTHHWLLLTCHSSHELLVQLVEVLLWLLVQLVLRPRAVGLYSIVTVGLYCIVSSHASVSSMLMYKSLHVVQYVILFVSMGESRADSLSCIVLILTFTCRMSSMYIIQVYAYDNVCFNAHIIRYIHAYKIASINASTTMGRGLKDKMCGGTWRRVSEPRAQLLALC